MAEDTPEVALRRVPDYLKADRLAEAERLLIGVLRGADEESDTYWDGLLTLVELYERQERFVEGLILSREVPQRLRSHRKLGRRGLQLRARLHRAEGEEEAAQECLSLLTDEH